ncbi:hypothetical protein LIER_29061 [Lithospermum erythrorhizon]|uniref:Uncharacterized protein n=1 Tax=Lithospermum erythrorhizon TaxID=34254 RepID=A0AAV3RL63_LITER
MAKVSWDTVCLPLVEGGLGFKDMFDWNQVCLCKLLWNIASRKETLWVQWVHTVRLKGVSVWGYKKRKKDPWYWKKILRVRPLVQDNDQERVSLRLPNDVSLREALPLRLPRPRRRTTKILRLDSEASLVTFSTGEDKWGWRN